MAQSDQDLLDMAIDMFNEGSILPQQEPISKEADPSVPDISNINISAEDVDALLEGRNVSNKERKRVGRKVVAEGPSKKRDLLDILAEFTEIMSQAKDLIAEMTTCGAIGVNLAPKKSSKKKTKTNKIKLRAAKDIMKDHLK